MRSRTGYSLSLGVVLAVMTVTVSAGPPVCAPGSSSGPVQAPVFVDNLSGQTSWFASPVVADLDGDGANELIAAYYNVYVFGSDRSLLDTATDGSGRVYAPHVVADLDGDGIIEVVAGRGHQVWAWEWKGGALEVKNGWPADTTTGGISPEIRGMAAADLDGDLEIEIVVTTTQTATNHRGRGTGLRLLSRRQHLPARRRPRPRLAQVQQPHGNRQRRRPQRPGPLGLRLLRAQRRHRQHRRRPRARDPGDLRQPPHPGLRSRRGRHRHLRLLHQPKLPLGTSAIA